MQSKVLTTVLWATIALCVSACATSRRSLESRQELRVESVASRDSLIVESVAVSDTLREVTVITVQVNEQGDTLKQSIVTDHTRASTRDRVHDVKEKLIVRTDTVYIQRDSIAVKEIAGQARNEAVKKSPFVASLRWICFIILALTAFIIILKFSRRLL